MTGETEIQLGRIRRERMRQTFFNSSLMVGVIALAIAVVFLYVRGESAGSTTYVVVEEAQQALRVTCKVAEDRRLPANIRKKCDEANRGELTDRVAQVIDDPDPNDPEQNDPEFQDPEIQNSEKQDPEIQDSETQDPEAPDSEVDDPDPVDDPDINDPDPDDPEIQDPEIQEPEQQNAPVCSEGYVRAPFHWYGPDGVNGTADDEDWEVCKKVG